MKFSKNLMKINVLGEENMVVKLYSTKCPRCIVLEKKLQQKGVDFELITDFDIQFLIDNGFKSAPVLCVDDEFMDFTKANNWINERK